MNGDRAAVSLSEHPDARTASGEAIGAIRDQVPGPVSLLVVATLGGHSRHQASIASAAASLLAADTTVAIEVDHLLAGGQTVSDRQALLLLALDIDGLHVATDVIQQQTPETKADESDLVGLAFSVDHKHGAIVDGVVAGSSVRAMNVPLGHRPSVFSDGNVVEPEHLTVTVPANRAKLVSSRGPVEVGMPMLASTVDGLDLVAVDGQRPYDLLLSLTTADDGFVDGPSHRFPPLRVRPLSRPDDTAGAIDVVSIDEESGRVTLNAPLTEGEIIQFVRHDPKAAVNDVVSGLRRLPPGARGRSAIERANGCSILVSNMASSVTPTLARRSYEVANGSAVAGVITTAALAADDQTTDHSTPWPVVSALNIW